jgi:hypothetical protein
MRKGFSFIPKNKRELFDKRAPFLIYMLTGK